MELSNFVVEDSGQSLNLAGDNQPVVSTLIWSISLSVDEGIAFCITVYGVLAANLTPHNTIIHSHSKYMY